MTLHWPPEKGQNFLTYFFKRNMNYIVTIIPFIKDKQGTVYYTLFLKLIILILIGG